MEKQWRWRLFPPIGAIHPVCEGFADGGVAREPLARGLTGGAPAGTFPHMKKLLGFIGASVGGSVGWAVGKPVGMMTAFMLSIVGTGLGIYAGKRLADRMES